MDSTTAPPSRARLKAATLLESVLALALLAGASSIAMVIYQRTLATSRAFQRAAAWSATERVLDDLVHYPAGTTEELGGGLELTVDVVPAGKGLQAMTFTCAEGDRTILERRVLLPAP